MELGLHHRPTKTEQEAIEAMRAFREKIRIAAHDLERRKQDEKNRKTELLLQKEIERAAEREKMAAFQQIVGDTAVLIQGDIRRIQDLICEHMLVSRADLLSVRRFHRGVLARQMGMYLCKLYTSRSYPEIGRRFGGRDHSTVIHAIRKIETIVAAPDGAAYGPQDDASSCDLIRDQISQLRLILGPVQ